MTLDVFLKLGDIKGESTDDRHKDEILVLSWDWGITQTIVHQGGGGSSAAKAQFRNLRFAHRIDTASPQIMLACASGKHIKDAKFTVRRQGAARLDAIILQLTDVLIAGVDAAVNEANGELFESVTLDFARIRFDYMPQLPNGSQGTPVKFSWDIAGNRPV
jgi:type VI secretion system secreted protein Hcp